jgi:branched-chain amino acid transport system substrate-binding protein
MTLGQGGPRLARLFGALAGAFVLALASLAAAQQQGQPIRIGSTLSLTGPLAQTSVIHKIAGDIFVEDLNKRGGMLGRPVEWIVLDDQSKPDVTRTLYERLITVDKVDLIIGPYGTASILAAIGIAQRYQKMIVHGTMGIPHLATYDMQFSANTAGAEPNKTFPEIVFDAYKNTSAPPKTVLIATSKFPSTQFVAEGARDVAKMRGLEVVGFLEYDFGNRDFGPIAARIKDTDPDLLFVGAIGVDANLILEALSKLSYKPKRHFYLYPAPGPLALLPAGEFATAQATFEDTPPFTSTPAGAYFAKTFTEHAKAANLPYPYADTQASGTYSSWQVLAAAVAGTKSLDDKKLAAWLRDNEVETVSAKRDFKGKFNTSRDDQQVVRQVQGAKWVVVWPPKMATPGAKLIVP